LFSAVLATLLLATGLIAAVPASGQSVLGSDKLGSVLVFPKVVSDASTDTMIEIFNAGTDEVYLRCFYIRGAIPRTRTEMRLTLTRQQPTHWVVSRGRSVNPDDPPCSPDSLSCGGAGEDPGVIPAMPAFLGELICVQTDATHEVVIGNALGGQATIRDLVQGDVSQYPALRLAGDPDTPSSNTLCLGAGCDTARFDACPRHWTLSHLSDTTTAMTEGEAAVDATEITAVYCTQNLATLSIPAVLMNFSITNELEQRFGGALVINGWANLDLGALGVDRAALGTLFVQTQISTSPSDGGLFIVARQQRRSGGLQPRRAASGLAAHHFNIPAAVQDSIVLPPVSAGDVP